MRVCDCSVDIFRLILVWYCTSIHNLGGFRKFCDLSDGDTKMWIEVIVFNIGKLQVGLEFFPTRNPGYPMF